MPLDPLDPNHLALSPEQRAADKFATLDRRIGVAERSSINTVTRNRLSDEELAEVSTSSTTYVDLGGPSITLNVPAGAFVSIFLEAELHGDVTLPSVTAALFEPTDWPTPEPLLNTQSGSYVLRRTAPGNVSIATLGSPVSYPATPGIRTYSIRYKSNGGVVFFRQRRLWVEVV